MEYELWQISRFAPGEPYQPLILIDKKQTFEEIYDQFHKNIKKTPCVIILNSGFQKKDEESATSKSSPNVFKFFYLGFLYTIRIFSTLLRRKN